MGSPTDAEADVIFRHAERDDEDVLRELYRDYLEVLARFNGEVDVGGELEEAWLTRPELLHAAVACRPDGEVAGFALVMGREYARAMGCDGEHYFHALLVREACRGTGVADGLVAWLFERYRGRWCLEALTENRRAVEFWRRVVAPYAPRVEVREGLFTHVHFRVPEPSRS